jgi:acyl carrier protein
MTRDDIQDALTAELHRIAPEIEIDAIDRTADLRDEFDIDSIDFMNLVAALGRRFELEMPEADYPMMDSFDHLLDYLTKRTA